MLICSMILLLTVCSFLGWVYESLYAIVTTGKWESRGFLYGPVCPIYGIGVVTIVLITKQIVAYAGFEYEWVHVALVAFFGSMILEYVTSWVLEKLFHAYWWDYSNMPLNINGRTCIPAACLFCLGGLAAVYLVSPAWDALVAPIPFTVIEIAAMIVISLFSIDATLTVSSLTNFQKQVATIDVAFNTRAAELTDKMTSFGLDARERMHVSRERFIEGSLVDLTKNMSGITRTTLSRVRGFLPATDEERSRLAHVLKIVKDRRDGQAADYEQTPTGNSND